MGLLAIPNLASDHPNIRRNAAAFGVPTLEIIEGEAPAALDGLRQPDAIFIGGGASRPGMLDKAVAAVPAGGRLVVNAVTLDTEALLLARHAAMGGEMLRIAMSRVGPVGGAKAQAKPSAWRPALPVTQWVWVKP